MSAIISSQMRTNLANLLKVTDEMGATQQRVSTGKKVSSAADDPAAYYRAQGLGDRATRLENVNQNLSLAMSNISTADKAMSVMTKNLNAQLSLMTDALSASPGAPASAVSPTGVAVYAGGTAASLVTATATDGLRFQNGDQITFTITAADGTTRTGYFQAATTPASPNGSGLATGTPPTPSFYQFNTVADLKAGLQNVLGLASIDLKVTAGNKLNVQLTDPTSSLSIQQITDAGGAGAGVTADLSQIFGPGSSMTYGTAGQAVTYQPKPATTNDASLAQRKAAAVSFRTMLNQIDKLARDGAYPGFPNLLTGGVMKVDLNEQSTSAESVALAQKLDLPTLGFDWDDVAKTSADVAGDFATDAELSAAIGKIKSAIQSVGNQQQSLGSQSAMLNTRLGFNKDMVSALNAGSDLITAADMTAEAAALASQQTLQSFASNNLSITKAAEQSLLQFLR